MNNKDNVKEFVWKLMDVLRGAMIYRELHFSVIRMIFLKYVVDNFIGAKTVEDMQACSRAQKMFSMRDVDNGLEAVIPVFQYIDDAYGLDGLFTRPEIIENYSNELFGNDNRGQRKNTSSNNYKVIMDLLCSVDLEEKQGETKKGELFTETLVDLIVSNSYRSMYASEHTSKPQLNKLVSKILDLQDDDVYCDYTSGVGLSTLEIVRNKDLQINNADINSSAITVSTMLLIMSGYRNIQMKCADTLTQAIDGISGNKIFVDAPFGIRLPKTEGNEFSDGSLAVIYRAINNYLSIKEDSMAVITLPSAALFQAGKQWVSFRSELVSSGLVKSIIALPSMRMGTNININLLILTRKHNDKVTFVNATEFQQQSLRKNDNYGDVALPDELIERIINAYNSGANVEGFSKSVSLEEISEKNYNLVSTVYVSPIVEHDDTTLEEINTQLDELYKQLLGG